MSTEVHAAKADEENEGDTGHDHRPAPEAFEAPGEEQGQGAVKPTARVAWPLGKRVTGGVVAGVEELRTGALKDPLRTSVRIMLPSVATGSSVAEIFAPLR